MKFSTWLDADHRCVYKSNCSFSTRKSLLSSQVRAKREKKKKLNLTTSHLFISDIQPIYTWTNVVCTKRKTDGEEMCSTGALSTLWVHRGLTWGIECSSMKMSRGRDEEENCVLSEECFFGLEDEPREKRESQSQAAAFLFYMLLRVLGRKEQEIQMFLEFFFQHILPLPDAALLLLRCCQVFKCSCRGYIFFLVFFSSTLHHVFSIYAKKKIKRTEEINEWVEKLLTLRAQAKRLCRVAIRIHRFRLSCVYLFMHFQRNCQTIC